MLNLPRIMILCLALLTAPAANATAQMSDVLILDGKEFGLNTNPLEAELEQKKWLPPEEAVISSANWRGYVATWEVRGEKLFLKDITIRVRSSKQPQDWVRKNILADLYPGASEVFASCTAAH